ncbi:hypothetical protein ITI46_08830 [Streptomyces oryzae]|uniref:Uncharacterized protein n=1 Tax=Streptomyces oryzae TaxID=1434886 RepID=A0ABS3X8U1_9ACTN|nr:hypothetical protein [Streptomyces oryzae]MBO8191783.1 hypothetical protein [Streptomyces oryzae]
MNDTVNTGQAAAHTQGLTPGLGHPAGTVDLTADLPDEGATSGAVTVSTQPFFDCCG